MAGKIKNVRRRIHFYRATTEPDAAGTPIPVKFQAMLGHLQSLKFGQGQGALYYANGDGTENAAYSVTQQRLTFATLRREDLPRLEDGNGTIRDLEIGARDGLFEPIHVQFFANAIIGAEYNFYGPRIGRLETYLKAKVPLNVRGADFTIDALLRDEPQDQLKKLSTVTKVDLKMRRAHAEELQKARSNDLFDKVTDTAQFGEVEHIELILSAGRGKTASLSKGLVSAIKQAVGMKAFRQEAEKLKVTGIDYEKQKSVTYDLLADQLVAEKSVVGLNERTRAVESASAFAAIAEAYKELKPLILLAASITP